MKLSKEQRKEIEGLIKEITDEAKKVVDDYVENPTPSEMRGSITQVHQNSPLLKDKKNVN